MNKAGAVKKDVASFGHNLMASRFQEQAAPNYNDDLMEDMRMGRQVPAWIGLNDTRAIDFWVRKMHGNF
jgi:hypothetical protein